MDLPDGCLALILRKIETLYSLSCAIAAHRQLAQIAKSCPETWRSLADTIAWRLRRRSNEGWAELCKRASSGVLKQRVVAIGGAKQLMTIPSVDDAAVEVYSFGEGDEGAWHAATPLRRARDAPCAASDGVRVHVIGGWDGEENHALVCGESAAFGHHGSSLCWEPLPKLSHPRCFAAAVCDEEARLWVLGGGNSLYRGARCLDSIDVLSPEGWSRIGTLYEPRCGLAVALDSRRSDMIVCGGYSGGERHTC